MKILKTLTCLFVSLFLMSTAYAASSGIRFTNYPSSPQTVSVGQTIALQYTIQSTMPGPQSLIGYAFTQNSLYAVNNSQITSNCGTTISAQATCTIKVLLTGVSTGTVTNPELTVYYGATGVYLTSKNSLTITVSGSAPAPVTYNIQPEQSSYAINPKTNNVVVQYKITNDATSGSNLVLSGATFTPSTTSLTATLDSTDTTCESSLTPGNSCIYAASVTSTSSTKGSGTVSIALNNPNGTLDSSSVTSTTVYFGPSTLPSAAWSFNSAPSALTLTVGNSTPQHLNYTFTNNSATNSLVLLNAGSFIVEQSFSSDVATLGTSSLNCDTNGSKQPSKVTLLPPGHTCTYTIPVTAGTTAGTGTVTLTVAPQNGVPASGSQAGSVTVTAAAAGNIKYTIEALPAPAPTAGGKQTPLGSYAVQTGKPLTTYYVVKNLEKTAGNDLTITGFAGATAIVPFTNLTTAIPTNPTMAVCSTSTPLAAGASCEYAVSGTAPSSASAMTQGKYLGLTVQTSNGSFNDQGNTAGTAYASVVVVPPHAASWSFGAAPPTAVVGINSTTRLTFQIKNTTNVSAPLFLKASDFTVDTTGLDSSIATVDTATLTCAASKNNQNVLLPGASCFYTVPITGVGKGTGSIEVSATINGGTYSQIGSVYIKNGNGGEGTQWNVVSTQSGPLKLTTTSGKQTLDFTVTNTGPTPLKVFKFKMLSSNNKVLTNLTYQPLQETQQDCGQFGTTVGPYPPTDNVANYCVYEMSFDPAAAGAGEISLEVVTNGSTPVQTASTPLIEVSGASSTLTPLSIQGTSTTQTMGPSGQLILKYLIQNPNSSDVPFTPSFVTVSSGVSTPTLALTPTFLGTCKNVVPAHNNCVLLVGLEVNNKTTPGTLSNQSLQLNFGNNQTKDSSPISIVIPTPSSSGLLITSNVPHPVMGSKANQNIIFTLTNRSSNPINVPSISAASVSSNFPNDVALAAPVGTPDAPCQPNGLTLLAGASCSLSVNVTGLGILNVTPGVSVTLSVMDTNNTVYTGTTLPIRIAHNDWEVLVPQQPPSPFALNTWTGVVFEVKNEGATPILLQSFELSTKDTVISTGASTIPSLSITAFADNSANGRCVPGMMLKSKESCQYPAKIYGKALSQSTLDATAFLTVTTGGADVGSQSGTTAPVLVVNQHELPQISVAKTGLFSPREMFTNSQQVIVVQLQNSSATYPVTLGPITLRDVAAGANGPTDGSTASTYPAVITNFCSSSGAAQVPVSATSPAYCYLFITESSNNTPGVVHQILHIPYASGELIQPINFEVKAPPLKRQFTFVNKCDFPVWVGALGAGTPILASTQADNPPKTQCNSNADCPTNSSCITTNTATGVNQCFWNAPVPPSNNYELLPNTNSVWQIPFEPGQNKNYLATIGEIWGGTFVGRTGCNIPGLKTCMTADCSQGALSDVGSGLPGSSFPLTGSCMPGGGPQPPMTKIEPLLVLGNVSAPAGSNSWASTQDYYDISMVNGFNIPAEITPDNAPALDPSNTSYPLTPYICTAAGGSDEINVSTSASTNGGYTGTIGGCNWTFNWPSSWNGMTGSDAVSSYVTRVFVPAGLSSKKCSSNNECSSNQVCGIDAQDIKSGTLTPHCGTFAGYWAPGDVCADAAAANVSLGAPYNCKKSSDGGVQLIDWYQCSAADGTANTATTTSCYNVTTKTNGNCCGCMNWDEFAQGKNGAPLSALFPQGTTLTEPTSALPDGTTFVMACPSATQSWMQSALPIYAAAKIACPSAYTYQFDDKTSTFMCGAGENGSGRPTKPSNVNYTVTFCPKGQTGAPSSASLVREALDTLTQDARGAVATGAFAQQQGRVQAQRN